LLLAVKKKIYLSFALLPLKRRECSPPITLLAIQRLDHGQNRTPSNHLNCASPTQLAGRAAWLEAKPKRPTACVVDKLNWLRPLEA